MGKRTFIGNFIHSSWSNINIRAGKYKHLQTEKKNKNYSNISIEFTREEYKLFCIENEELIKSLERPSIDRINKSKNYTLDNIQFIELSENIRKDKLKAKNNRCVCYKCSEEKELEEFSKNKKRINGRSTICKVCDSLRKRK